MTTLRITGAETLSSGHLALRRYTVEQIRRDGTRETLRREVCVSRRSVAVLLADPARGTVLLVRQPRVPALVNGDDPLLLEACAGNIDDGESPEAAARREVEEETGHAIARLRPLFELYPSPGISSERLCLFQAEIGPRIGQGGGMTEEGEDIALVEMPFDEAWAMMERGGIVDAKTVILLQQARLHGLAVG
ncbi:NUDIX domain-containing protein [Roseomonas sp. NAR14]|uniref:GDP-mannose pyrophosphatase n=1 Tax=Roseomonas acroporae TaxID=2937791 RepID=A0A9X1YDV1_9PROT|nr:NUDIX domain-containing protein [Roseomonas acroporae]MCK8787220.1 NUDIX domain-containing protein [Roseomonas acroporae]